MPKRLEPTLHKTTHTEITSLFGDAKLVLGETPKAISPFGGLASFISFLGQIGFAGQVQRVMPFAEPAANNSIPLAHCLTAFMMSVVVGARRFAHSEWLRADRVLHALLGMPRFPSDDTIRNFFLRFSQGHIELFWRPLWRWLLGLLRCPAEGFSLDLDSTVFCREGQQEGALKGFNPRRQGHKSHHPLLAVLAEAPFVLHGWLRSGNTRASRGAVAFLQEALSLLPEGTSIRTVRADSGFFDQALLDFLEERGLPYVMVAPLTSRLKRQCAGVKQWTLIDEHLAAGELWLPPLGGAGQARRFVIIRERLRETKPARGRQLLEVPGYTFRIWVTNRTDSALELWRDYNQRACVEQRIEELKQDLGVHGFCLHSFFATESAFLAILFGFNLLSLYQHQITAHAPYRQPGTLRVAVFLSGAILGVAGRKLVLKLSAAWGGLAKHKPLVDATLNWLNCASPKLVPPEDRLAIGGAMI